MAARIYSLVFAKPLGWQRGLSTSISLCLSHTVSFLITYILIIWHPAVTCLSLKHVRRRQVVRLQKSVWSQSETKIV